MTETEQGRRLVLPAAPSKRGEIWLYAIPMLFCLAVHWMAIKTWFSADDFAWLGLPLELHPTLGSWLDVFFGPRAQGTIRTLSERAYFVVFTSIFGLNALPFRLWAFLTQFANIALLIGITRRLTGSRWAALIAAVLWGANAGLALALNWSSAYNEICCSFFLLASLYCLLNFIETGERKYWIRQWIVFLLGFGALELIVTYPAIAALYTWLFARQYFRKTFWLFIPSALFTAAHFLFIPIATDPNYTMHFDRDLPVTLWKYFAFAVAAARADVVDWRPLWLGLSLAIAIALAGVFLLRRNPKLTVFCSAWFVIVLLPVLPLKNHFTEYYVTMPALGLAILGAWALTTYPRVAAVLAAVYLVVSITDVHAADKYYYERARHMKRLVLALQEDQVRLQDKMVLLTSVGNDLFWSGFFDDPFRLLGIREIFLAPGSEKVIEPHPEWGGIERFRVPVDAAFEALGENKAVVLQVEDRGVEDITNSYRSVLAADYLTAHREWVDAGNPFFQKRLGAGWYQIEDGYRWMGKSASLQLGGPVSPAPRLQISGYSPAPVLAQGPLELTVRVENNLVGSALLKNPDEHFHLDFPVPPQLDGRYSVTVSLEVSRTIQIGADLRQLGLIFGTFRMK